MEWWVSISASSKVQGNSEDQNLLAKDVSVHWRRVGPNHPERSLPTQTILRFYELCVSAWPSPSRFLFHLSLGYDEIFSFFLFYEMKTDRWKHRGMERSWFICSWNTAVGLLPNHVDVVATQTETHRTACANINTATRDEGSPSSCKHQGKKRRRKKKRLN